MPAEQRVPTASEGRAHSVLVAACSYCGVDVPPGALLAPYGDGSEGWQVALHLAEKLAFAAQPASGAGVRVDRSDFPEIIQAVRWSDEDNGTNHFEPGVGFIVDDPDGVTVPKRWVEHLPLIEAALAGLDHGAPHPLDVDMIEYLEKNGQEPTIHDSAAYCFVCGEHTPMTAMSRTSRELWIASRFLNEYFEGWAFDPASGWEAAVPTAEVEPAIPAGEGEEQPGDYLRDKLLNIATICEAKALLVEASGLRDTANIISEQMCKAGVRLDALKWIDGEAPAKEPRDGPTVGFQPSCDPEEDDGNDTVREAFDEGVGRGLWLAARAAREAI